MSTILEKNCKHDQGFTFFSCTAADRLPGIWACNFGCGYSLNFNPDEYLTGIVYRAAKPIDTIIEVGGPSSGKHLLHKTTFR